MGLKCFCSETNNGTTHSVVDTLLTIRVKPTCLVHEQIYPYFFQEWTKIKSWPPGWEQQCAEISQWYCQANRSRNQPQDSVLAAQCTILGRDCRGRREGGCKRRSQVFVAYSYGFTMSFCFWCVGEKTCLGGRVLLIVWTQNNPFSLQTFFWKLHSLFSRSRARPLGLLLIPFLFPLCSSKPGWNGDGLSVESFHFVSVLYQTLPFSKTLFFLLVLLGSVCLIVYP